MPRRSRRALITIAAPVVVVAGTALALLLALGDSGSVTARGSVEVDDFTGNCLTDPGFSGITQGTPAIRSPRSQDRR